MTKDTVKEATSAEEPVQRDEYSAKQVATRIGTDAKTLRKFFRSAASTVEPVGFGGRYNFAAEDLPKIREEFAQWSSKKNPRGRRSTKSTPRANTKVEVEPTIDGFDEFEDELDFEPTEEELLELDDFDPDFEDFE